MFKKHTSGGIDQKKKILEMVGRKNSEKKWIDSFYHVSPAEEMTKLLELIITEASKRERVQMKQIYESKHHRQNEVVYY